MRRVAILIGFARGSSPLVHSSTTVWLSENCDDQPRRCDASRYFTVLPSPLRDGDPPRISLTFRSIVPGFEDALATANDLCVEEAQPR